MSKLIDNPSASGSGVSEFINLTDVPASYSGQSLKTVRVNAGETGLEFATISGTGDVVGPASATDNAIVRYDSTTGKLIQNSGITIADGATGTLSGTNTGDQTSIVGITGSLAEFNAALTGADFATGGGTVTGASSGTNTGDQNLFQTIAVSGQSNVVADTTTDTLTLVAGTNITITTDAGTDSITINATSSGTGDVVGPGSATDNAITRYDSTTGKLIQNSAVILDDSANITGVNNFTATNSIILDSPTDAILSVDRGSNGFNREAAFDFSTAGVTKYRFGMLGVHTGSDTFLTLSDESGNTLIDIEDLGTTAKLTVAQAAITKLANLTSNGFVKTSGGDGTLSIDTNTYITGNQTITLSSDVTGSGTTAITATIANDAVTYAKMQNVSAASKLIGRGDSGSGDPQEITLGSGLTMTGTTLSSSGGSSINSGQVELDFGASESDSATVTVSAAWVTTSSKIVCNPSATATADHSVDEVWAEGINAYPTNIVNGVSFDIVAKSCGDGQTTWGKYNINYLAA